MKIQDSAWRPASELGRFEGERHSPQLLETLRVEVERFILPAIERGAIAPTPSVSNQYGFRSYRGEGNARYDLLIPSTEWNAEQSKFRPVAPEAVSQFSIGVHDGRGLRVTYGPFPVRSAESWSQQDVFAR